MTLLPIVEVTLRQASKKRWTYWSRVVGVVIAGLFAVPLAITAASMGFRSGFAMALSGFAPWIFLSLLSSGSRSTVDCISAEKREGTLGLLFLTDLKGHDVVLGKLTAACLQTFMSWLAMLPLASMLVLAGGFTWQDVLRLMLAIGNTLFAGAAAGLLGSSLCRERKGAMNVAVAWILVIGILSPAAAGIVRAGTDLVWLSDALFTIGPGTALFSAGASVGGATTSAVWIQLLVSHAVSWLAIAGACWFTPRRWQDKPAKQPAPMPAESFTASSTPQANGTAPESFPQADLSHKRQRNELLDSAPFAWLLTRLHWSPIAPWLTLIVAGFGATAIGSLVDNIGFLGFSVMSAWIALMAHLFIKSKIAEQSSQGIYDEKQSGSLEFLLNTRLTPREITAAHWKALRTNYGPAIVAMLIVDLFFILSCAGVFGFIDLSESQSESYLFTTLAWLYLFVTFLVDLPALVWVGMWEALRTTKKWNHVRGNAFGLVVMLPSGIFAISWGVLAAISALNMFRFSIDTKYVAIAWILFSFTASFLWIKLYRTIVTRRFRKVARETAIAMKST